MAPAATSTAAPSAPPSLSLPPSQFARLQPHAYLLAHLSPPPSSNQPSIRANGRATSQFRVTSANTGSLTHTNGSAVVRIGDTAAVCGVRAEILHTDDIASWSVSQASAPASTNKRRKITDTTEKPTVAASHENDDEDEDDESHIQDLNLLVPNLSLSTGCAPGFIPGAPPSALAQSLSHQILSLLHSTRLVRAEDLRIWYQPPNLGAEELERHNEDEQMDVDAHDGDAGSKSREIKAFWVLYIDVMIISLAGNAFDAAWAAVLAALRDTKLPKAWWDVDNEMVVCSEAVSKAHKLSLRGMPVASSFCVFEADAASGWRKVIIPDAEEERKIEESDRKGIQRRWILADPDGYEESLSQERICIVTVIVRMEKNGGLAADTRELKQLVDISAQRWDDMKRILDSC
ncbi:3' exoribonuclease family protein [Aspergillus novofumigatus IBT 16806]|uniref:Ribosomal RNA-processing protein 43 n=1 Tax=Aspergillus novofumigatus (strain IBT 16806) TaxID=1392255 RepID=A0A2I1CES8_ASPN1|nr:exoribonuclease family protein [Aspergillus novofumigatus IBT 16806]PKX96129.1 exoribonuclease family protein [Aspergillus novofumigatus IBT 16806]